MLLNQLIYTLNQLLNLLLSIIIDTRNTKRSTISPPIFLAKSQDKKHNKNSHKPEGKIPHKKIPIIFPQILKSNQGCQKDKKIKNPFTAVSNHQKISHDQTKSININGQNHKIFLLVNQHGKIFDTEINEQ